MAAIENIFSQFVVGLTLPKPTYIFIIIININIYL